MAKYSIFRPVYPVEHCYLSEVLYWRAFGRVPEQAWAGDKPWRTSSEIRESQEAPVPQGLELDDDECRYAELQPDPRMQALEDETFFMEPEFYQEHLNRLDPKSPKDRSLKTTLRQDLEDAYAYHEAVANWLEYFNEYTDQFRNEICLDLQHGRLTAYATELPAPTYEKSEAILEDQDIWFDDLEVVDVPPSCWISTNINWDDSALYGRERSFIWIHLEVSKMLENYPPDQLIDSSKVFPTGSNVAIIDVPVSETHQQKSRRGRPPLPWESFHVEVARLYQLGDMPEKQEAAIAYFREWFAAEHDRRAARTTIREKLKPYFDTLGKKGRK